MIPPALRETTLHAGCLLLGEAGVLIRGPSGSGKSTLARRLILAGTAAGFSRLVSDDRVRVANRHGRLVARAVPAIAGLMEAHGIGLLGLPFEPAAVVRLVVDRPGVGAVRYPEVDDAEVEICGVVLPRIVHAFDTGLDSIIALCAGNLRDRLMAKR